MHRLNRGKGLLETKGRTNGEKINYSSLKIFRFKISTSPNQKLSIYKNDFTTNEMDQQVKAPASEA